MKNTGQECSDIMVQALYTTQNIVDISSDTVHCTLTCGMSNRNEMGSTTQSICCEMGSWRDMGQQVQTCERK